MLVEHPLGLKGSLEVKPAGCWMWLKNAGGWMDGWMDMVIETGYIHHIGRPGGSR